MSKKNVIIIGAAGRDFQNFNTYYRGNEDYNVVAFTAAQIPDIEGRKYPAELAGSLYPDGIPIHAEEDLSKAKPYALDGYFEVGDIIQHKKFGPGSVLEVKPGGKMEVGFEEGGKLLVCRATK